MRSLLRSCFCACGCLLFSVLPSEARTFTSVDGRTIEADLVDVAGETAKIKRSDGTEFALPVSSLSPSDREFIEKWEAERKAKLSEGAPKPGETLTFEFPELPKDFRGEPAAFKVKIPASYDPFKPVPLIIFLPGGNGGNDPGGATGLTKGDFVCAGLPYPD
ncbi:MAG: hypothetical protein KDM63_15820, partial [Verrucomicrobiae bacterium]|nr:hypothetical protein [Verrucomicrobiae bacterium]